MPDDTIFTALPELVVYYLTRWSLENQISTYYNEFDKDNMEEKLFDSDPGRLLETIHNRGISPFPDMGGN